MHDILVPLALAGLLSAQTVPAPSGSPLPGAGPWVAQFEETMCVLSRPYGPRAAPSFQLAFRPVPGDDDLEIALLMPNTAKHFFREGKGRIELLPGGQTAEIDYRDYSTKDGRNRLVRTFAASGAISDLAGAKSMRITLGKRGSEVFHVALANTGNALETIRGCEDDLVRSWGFDPVALRTLKEPPRPRNSPQHWVTNDDYPAAAFRFGADGVVRLRLNITAGGKVSSCTIVEGSGVKLLDDTACGLLVKRASFSPAIAPGGTPVASLWATTFRWEMPM